MALALSAMPSDLRSRFRADPAVTVIDPAAVATARGQRLGAAGGAGDVASARQRN